MGFPLGHLAERADHGEVHHRAGLGVDDVVAPAEAPAPGRHRLLKRPGEIIRGGEVLLHILGAKRCLAALQPLEKQVFVKAAGHGHTPSLIAMFLGLHVVPQRLAPFSRP
jgi:DNA-directed RNA polymerase specialized sigma24 family protein